MKKIKMDIILYALLIFSLGLTIFSLLAFQVDDVKINNENVESFNIGWTYGNQAGEEINLTLPQKVASIQNETVSMQNKIPDKWKGLTIAFPTSDQRIKIYIDEMQIYRFGYDDVKAFGHTPGSAWHFVPIPHDLSNGEIRIEISSAYPNGEEKLPSIYVGTKSACIYNLLRSNLQEFLVSASVMMIGIILIVLYFILNKMIAQRKSFMYLGLFSLLMSFASMIETKLLQIVVGNQTFFSNSIFLLHMLAPIPILLYVGETYLYKWKKQYQFLIKVYVLNYIITVVLQITNLFDFMETKGFLHALVVFTCFYMCYTTVQLLRSQKKQVDLICFCMGLFILMTSVIADLIHYYFFAIYDAAQYYRVGLLVYVVILSALELKRTIVFVKKGIDSKILNKIVYEDGLTKCKNRMYFEENISEAGRQLAQITEVGIAIFDINDLKKINDYKGHREGDSMLIHASQMIKEYFSQYAHVSRIGGDEFALVIKGVKEAEIEHAFLKFHAAMKENSKNIDATYDIAYGYAYYRPELDKDLIETFNRADSNMYARKERMKKSAFE